MSQKRAEKAGKVDADGGDAVPVKPGGGMLGVSIVAAGALVSSFATVYLFSSPPSAHTDGQAAARAVPKTPAMVTANHIYVELPEILVTVGGEPATRYLKLKILIICDDKSESSVSKSEPVLMDAFINYLRSVELTDFEDPGFYAHMRDQLRRRSQLVLGSDVSNGVLITEFLLR